MLGIIISGRPVLTESTTISPTQIAFTFPAAPPFSHLVVFLLPGATLPAGQSAAVYLQLTPAEPFRLLGALNAGKQSAIFRVREAAGTGLGAGGVSDDGEMMMEDSGSAAASGGANAGDSSIVTIGVSLEPDAQVAAALEAAKANQKNTSSTSSTQIQPFNTNINTNTSMITTTPAGSTSSSSSVPTKVLAQRIIANAYNFLASFSGSGPAGSEVVPLKSFQDWWVKFERKVEMDPGFLERPAD